MEDSFINMALDLYDMLGEICNHKSNLDFDDPEIDKAYDIYMINRNLSMMEFFIPFVQCMNKPGINKRDHYNFFRNIIPKSSYRFNYIKKTADDQHDENIKYLCRLFEIGKRDAESYLDLLKPDQLKKLKKMYSYGKEGKKNSVDAE